MDMKVLFCLFSYFLNSSVERLSLISPEMLFQRTEVVAQRCSAKKVLLEISQNSQENTCAGVSFNKVAGLTSGGSDTALTVSEQE